MWKTIASIAAIAAVTMAAAPASADRGSHSQRAELPTCARPIGAISIVEPDDNWWQRYDLDSPEAVINLLVLRSGCFTIVDRGRGLRSRNLERALADNGDLQAGSNFGGGQVRAADFFIIPDIIATNRDSGGFNIGGAFGGIFGSTLGGTGLGINTRRKEANVSLTLVNARTTETLRLTEGYHRQTDTGFSAGLFGGGGIFGSLGGGLGVGTYENTEIGQVVAAAYLDAYTDLVAQLGGVAAQAPVAQ
ncbi:MAG: CsgG/HfaB family protein [Parasphingopyxis sp.]|uniref:CsgG/HfaB family protein n=1 Tax=Parasphingopyxis sp. TaxID=1920299 RepID=UPI003FA03A89